MRSVAVGQCDHVQWLRCGRTAQAQTEFPQTLNWGSGMIDARPHGSRLSLVISSSIGRRDPVVRFDPSVSRSGRCGRPAGLALWARRGCMSVLSQDFEHGFYGQVLLLNQDDLRGRAYQQLPSSRSHGRTFTLGRHAHASVGMAPEGALTVRTVGSVHGASRTIRQLPSG